MSIMGGSSVHMEAVPDSRAIRDMKRVSSVGYTGGIKVIHPASGFRPSQSSQESRPTLRG